MEHIPLVQRLARPDTGRTGADDQHQLPAGSGERVAADLPLLRHPARRASQPAAAGARVAGSRHPIPGLHQPQRAQHHRLGRRAAARRRLGPAAGEWQQPPLLSLDHGDLTDRGALERPGSRVQWYRQQEGQPDPSLRFDSAAAGPDQAEHLGGVHSRRFRGGLPARPGLRRVHRGRLEDQRPDGDWERLASPGAHAAPPRDAGPAASANLRRGHDHQGRQLPGDPGHSARRQHRDPRRFRARTGGRHLGATHRSAPGRGPVSRRRDGQQRFD